MTLPAMPLVAALKATHCAPAPPPTSTNKGVSGAESLILSASCTVEVQTVIPATLGKEARKFPKMNGWVCTHRNAC